MWSGLWNVLDGGLEVIYGAWGWSGGEREERGVMSVSPALMEMQDEGDVAWVGGVVRWVGLEKRTEWITVQRSWDARAELLSVG